jgi:hypothetical protein
MGLFRREPVHQRLAREAGMLAPDVETLRPSWDKVGVHGMSRPRTWDAVVTTEAEGIQGDAVEFVTLADGTLVVEREDGDAELAPLADAVELEVSRPYRAQAVRKSASLWAVAARRIDVAQFAAQGDELELTAHEGGRTLLVDGQRAFGSVPELEALGEQQGRSYAARAQRIDGDSWEVLVDAL